MESNNTDQIKEATEKLTKVFYDMSEQLYKNANPNGAAGVDPNAANGEETKMMVMFMMQIIKLKMMIINNV